LLVECDLRAISAPRLGRVTLIGPDNSSAYRAEKKYPLLFFATGGGKVLGGGYNHLVAFDVKVNRWHPVVLPAIEFGKSIEMRLDTFVDQRVLCYRSRWASRAEVIKYVANVASGVHSGVPANPQDELLAMIRNSLSLKKKEDGSLHLDMFPGGVDTDQLEFKRAPDSFDPVLIELLAAATFLAQSHFVAELEKVIRHELGAG
jgi:hypothetical protein